MTASEENNTSSNFPYRSFEERNPAAMANQSAGANHSRSNSESSFEAFNDEEPDVDLEEGFVPPRDGGMESGSRRRVDDGDGTVAKIPVGFEDSVGSLGKRMARKAPKKVASIDSSDAKGEDSFDAVSLGDPAQYHWKLYAPDKKNVGKFVRWAMVGGSKFTPEQTDEDLLQSLLGLAHCLHLLREYLSQFGMPERGGPQDQEYVLKEVVRDLYSGGTPLWALQPVMQRVAEGLTGHPNVNWQLHPRKAFVYNPSAGTTIMFNIDRGFNMTKLSAMERVAVRLASFASNVQGVSNIPARFPNPQELQSAARAEGRHNLKVVSKTKLARDILNLASKQQGLFYYVNSHQYKGGKPEPLDVAQPSKRPPKMRRVDTFWVVTDEERELFSRLACQEALTAIHAIDARATDPDRKTIHTPGVMLASRVVASAGACAFWFGGSWQDMLVAGCLAVLVSFMGTFSLLTQQERMVYEVVASFIVGLTGGLLTQTWPNHLCFQAIAICGVLHLLQGYRVVFAIIEIMSKHTVAGGADLFEGILFTALISYFLQFGSYTAASLFGDSAPPDFKACTNGLNEYWYILTVPATSLAWAFIFTPNPRDLAVMTFHGTLAYGVHYCLQQAGVQKDLDNFVSATALSLSAGICSRFTGRNAVGNTIVGLYALLPGTYMVSSVYSKSFDSEFFTHVVKRAVVLGIGTWTGSILCSPTLLGTTMGLRSQRPNHTTTDPILRRQQSYKDLARLASRSPYYRKDHNNQAVSVSSPAPDNGRERTETSPTPKSKNIVRSSDHQQLESDAASFDEEHSSSIMLYF